MTLNAIAPPFLGERVFLAQDQLSFAQASGDFNPMHVDAIAARRLLSGQAVVHGIHTLLCALQWWLAAHPTRPAGIACHFANPVNVGDVVVFAHCRDAEGRLVITASVDGLVCTEVVIDSARTEPATVGGAQNAAAGPPVRHLAAASAALDEPPGQQVGQVMALAAAPNGLAGLFPDVARVLGDDRLSAIAGLSFYVGMVCPGLICVFVSAVQAGQRCSAGRAAAIQGGQIRSALSAVHRVVHRLAGRRIESISTPATANPAAVARGGVAGGPG